MDGRPQRGTAEQDVPTTTSATGADPEAWRRRAGTGDTDDTGPGGANRCAVDLGTDLGGGPGAECLRVSSAEEGAGGVPASGWAAAGRGHGCSRRELVEML